MGTREDRIEELLAGVAELTTTEARLRYLESECGSDCDLVQEVLELLPYYLAGGSTAELLSVTAVPNLEEALMGGSTASREAVSAAVLESLAPANHPDAIGAIGSYEVMGVIGQGATGVVLKGYDPKLSRFVAIKVLAPHCSRDDRYQESFLAEARAMAAVSDPNVVAIHEVRDDRTPPYIVMEYIEGKSLAEILGAGHRYSILEILRIGIQLAGAVEAVHREGILHRDIKPSNILIERQSGRVALADFGVAVSAAETDEVLPAGTLRYMAPEQFRCASVDCRADIFSLGCVLYVLMYGAAPPRRYESGTIAPGPADSTTAACIRVDSGCERRALRDLQSLVACMIELAPDRRPASARSVHDRLREIADKAENKAGRSWRSRMWTSGLLGVITVLVATGVLLVAGRFPGPVARSGGALQPLGARVIAFDLFDRDAPDPFRVHRLQIATEPAGIRYWRPESSGEWGEVIYRFRFQRPIESATLACRLTIWHVYDPTAIAELYVSSDGDDWVQVAYLRDGYPDASFIGPVSLDRHLQGSTTVYVKARLKSRECGRRHLGVPLGPAYAQFLRCDRRGTYGKVFRLSVVEQTR